MRRKWGIGLLVLGLSLLLANANILAAEGKNPGPTNNPQEYELLDPETQLYIEQRINEKNLEDYEKIIEIKTKALEDRFDDYGLFAVIIIALLGIGGFGLIRYMVEARISKLKPEQKIQKKVDELYNIIESHKQDIDKLKQRAARDINKAVEEAKKIAKNIRPGEELTPEQEEIIKEAVEEMKKTPEEDFFADDYYVLAMEAAGSNNFEEAIKYGKIAIQLDHNFPDAYYVLARIYSHKKDKDNALEYLKLAIDKGFDDSKYIEKDPNLDFIRDTPEYQQIIKKLKAKLNR